MPSSPTVQSPTSASVATRSGTRAPRPGGAHRVFTACNFDPAFPLRGTRRCWCRHDVIEASTLVHQSMLRSTGINIKRTGSFVFLTPFSGAPIVAARA